MAARISKTLLSRFARIKLLLCDVDGILTDATVWIGSGVEMKRFCLPDGMGIRLLREAGIKTGWISGRPSTATEERARELKIDFLHQSKESKVVVAESILAKTGFVWEDVCYMGDDVIDLGLLKRAGVAVTVPGGMPEAKAVADYVTKNEGGHGAVREVVELILKSQKKWDRVIEEHSA
jgi:3-deoxy-D-manno-octulosonate 8-phosphate phosphatase (KDO 8-P phosphatase)